MYLTLFTIIKAFPAICLAGYTKTQLKQTLMGGSCKIMIVDKACIFPHPVGRFQKTLNRVVDGAGILMGNF
jgi:hypothetical protein